MSKRDLPCSGWPLAGGRRHTPRGLLPVKLDFANRDTVSDLVIDVNHALHLNICGLLVPEPMCVSQEVAIRTRSMSTHRLSVLVSDLTIAVDFWTHPQRHWTHPQRHCVGICSETWEASLVLCA